MLTKASKQISVILAILEVRDNLVKFSPLKLVDKINTKVITTVDISNAV
jgi:hypothetical protein